jgi:pentatricopeptide repeat protein
MIEVLYAAGQIDHAFDVLQRMRSKVASSNIEYYLDSAVVQAIDKTQSFAPRTGVAANDDVEEHIH